MSLNHQECYVFVDTGLLRDHVSKLREEKKIATRLRNNIRTMKKYEDPSRYGQYTQIFRDIDCLIDYLEQMVKILSNTEDDAVRLSYAIGNLLKDDVDNTYHIISDSFML